MLKPATAHKFLAATLFPTALCKNNYNRNTKPISGCKGCVIHVRATTVIPLLLHNIRTNDSKDTKK